MEAGDFERRRAPYAPISSLREFFQKMREMSVPQRIDRKYLRKLNVASNNEWALLSALKFLGVVDEHGVPTHAYRSLQRTDQFEDALRHLVDIAYAPLFDVGGLSMSADDLVNYFRVESSASQAKNAARFFREVCKLAGMRRIGPEQVEHEADHDREPDVSASSWTMPADESSVKRDVSGPILSTLLETKARLLEKLPAPRPEWSAAEYDAICRRFLEMLQNLDGSA